jgi:hypothetical protein
MILPLIDAHTHYVPLKSSMTATLFLLVSEERALPHRVERVFVWNTWAKSLEYDTEKWNEFLAA